MIYRIFDIYQRIDVKLCHYINSHLDTIHSIILTFPPIFFSYLFKLFPFNITIFHDRTTFLVAFVSLFQ